MGALLVMAFAVFLVAWPGSRPEKQPQLEEREQGVAKRGWLEDAERQFR